MPLSMSASCFRSSVSERVLDRFTRVSGLGSGPPAFLAQTLLQYTEVMFPESSVKRGFLWQYCIGGVIVREQVCSSEQRIYLALGVCGGHLDWDLVGRKECSSTPDLNRSVFYIFDETWGAVQLLEFNLRSTDIEKASHSSMSPRRLRCTQFRLTSTAHRSTSSPASMPSHASIDHGVTNL